MTTINTNVNQAAHTRSDRPWGLICVAVLALILIVRLVSLNFNTTALFFDEAQYWLWGKEPDFGYFSKPPVLGWIIGIFTAVCGSDSEFCVRLPSPIIHTGTSVLIYLSARRLFNSQTGFWSAVIFATLPGITLSSTLISTDVPLLFCWAGAFWAFLRLRDNNNWIDAILLGLFIGTGLMAKYAMAYFFLCALFYALFERSARKTIFSTKFLTATLISLLLISPNFWWNYQHKFITASHTSENIGWRGGNFHFDKMFEFLGSQFGVFGPILFAFLLIALVRFVWQGWDKDQKLLVMFSLPVLALITFQALMSKAYANWAAVTYVCATILIADILVNRVPPIWNRISVTIHGLIFVVLSIAVAFSAPGLLTLPNGKEPFERLQGWRDIADATQNQLDQSEYVAVIGLHRHLTAELVYYLRHRPENVLAFYQSGPDGQPSPRDHYQLTRPYRGLPNGPALLVATSEGTGKYARYFTTITPKGSAEFSSGKISKVWFYSLEGYRGLIDGAIKDDTGDANPSGAKP